MRSEAARARERGARSEYVSIVYSVPCVSPIDGTVFIRYLDCLCPSSNRRVGGSQRANANETATSWDLRRLSLSSSLFFFPSFSFPPEFIGIPTIPFSREERPTRSVTTRVCFYSVICIYAFMSFNWIKPRMLRLCVCVYACVYVCMTRVSRLGGISLYEYMFVYVYVHRDSARLDTIGVVFSPYSRYARARARRHALTRVHIEIYANGIYKIILYSCWYIMCCCCWCC